MKRIITLILIIMIILAGCSISGQPAQEFMSPLGTHRIAVAYDFVSRPSVFEVKWYGKELLWNYTGNGFMETVYFEVEWLTEDQFRISYDDANDEYDEEFLITIP